jgi:hypothetical protein
MIRRNPARLVTTKDKPWQPADVVVADAAGLDTVFVAALAGQLNALVVTGSGPQGASASIAHQGAKAV